MKSVKILICLAALCSAVVGCIYPFEPQIENSVTDQLVVEGDILVGSVSNFKISRSTSIYDKESNESEYRDYEVYVEGGDGSIYRGGYQGCDDKQIRIYSVDTRHLDKGLKYRLHINEFSDTNPQQVVKSYASAWSEVLFSAPVDNVTSYADFDDDNVHILISTHTDINSPYVKWFYDETYEYHSFYQASHHVDLNQMNVVKYTYGDPNHSKCYKTDNPDGIYIFDTSTLSGNQLVDHDLYTIDREDRKVSYLYRSKVSQIALTKEAYVYWKTLLQNSQDMGSLFSPQPSEVRGNIYCEDDSNEVVLGYISVSTVSSATGYYRDSDYNFHINTAECGDVRMGSNDNIVLYFQGFLPYGMDMGAVYWAPAKCVDCEVYGGSAYNKPEDWPE